MWSSMSRVVSLLLVLAAVGCDNQDADGEGGTLGGTGDCTENVTVIDPTEDPGLGFTAQDVLGNIAGNYPDTLVWSEADGGAYYHMPGTSVALSVEVSFEDGEVRYVSATPSGWCDGACADSCESRLEIDGVLALESEDGVLAESSSVVLEARSATAATYSVSFDPNQMQGTLSPESFVTSDGSEVETLVVEGTIGDGESSGSISVQFALSGEGGGFGAFVVGEW